MMKLGKMMLGLLALAAVLSLSSRANSEIRLRRQYYGSWKYYPQRSYHYVHYYYKPTPTYTDYNHHYCIYYPSRPRYVYYYNPHKKVYWGRYDTKEKGYSLLAEKDRKEELDDIPEKAFPEPGKMPPIPESKDEIAIDTPPAPPSDK